jgi:CDP-2,3-bis-(O-geranylgeranyl)-sn-glycerol synthase
MSIRTIVELMYLMLPAYCANMAAPFARFLPARWNRPIDPRRLGAHKTVMGFAFGVAVAVLVAFLQSRVEWSGARISYSQWPLIGLAAGAGALGGDAIKSYFKRVQGIAPGGRWIPADQLDFVVGAMLLLWPWARFTVGEVLVVVVLSFIGDIAVNHAAYWLRIRESKW